MYYGYELMWTLTFVPVGFAIIMAGSVAYCLVYAVGTSRGADACVRYMRLCNVAVFAASAGNLVYAIASGQAADFLAWYGFGPLAEMAVLGVMCIGSLWFMATAYTRSKVGEESAREAAVDA